MRYVWLAALCVSLLACEEGPPPDTSTSTAPPPSTTVPLETFSPAHSFSVGEPVAYEFELRREISSVPEGTPEAPLGDLSAPVDLVVEVSGTVTFQVEEAPDSGTFRLVPEVETGTTTVEGTRDGDPIEDQEDALGVIGGAGPLAGEVVVDPTGAITSTDGEPSLEVIPPPLTGIGPGLLGPVLPEQPVSMGAEWSAVHAGAAGGVDVDWETTGRVEELDGDLLVVTGESGSGEASVDLTEFYRDFLGSFQDGDAGDGVQLTASAGPSTVTWQGRFDPSRGRLTEGGMRAGTSVVLSGSAPGGPGGEVADFELRLEIRDDLQATEVPVG